MHDQRDSARIIAEQTAHARTKTDTSGTNRQGGDKQQKDKKRKA